MAYEVRNWPYGGDKYIIVNVGDQSVSFKGSALAVGSFPTRKAALEFKKTLERKDV